MTEPFRLICIICYLLNDASTEAPLTVAGFSVCPDHVEDARRAQISGIQQTLAWIRRDREAAAAADEGTPAVNTETSTSPARTSRQENDG